MNQSANGSTVITFDLGGVVVRVCPSAEMAAHIAGVPWREPRYPERFEEAGRLLDDWQVGHLSDDALFEAWADALGGRFDKEEARRLSEVWLMGEYDGIVSIVQSLHDEGARLGCLSNTCNHHWEQMVSQPDIFPSISLLTERHASHLLGHMKPDERIFVLYEQAVEASGADIVYFDDAPENIEAALARDWRAYHIKPNRSPSEQIFEYLLELGVLPLSVW